MLMLYPDVFAGAVLLRPMLPLEPDRALHLTGKPVYVASGTMDTMIPRHSTERLIELLDSAGADLSVGWKDAGHGLKAEELPAIGEWMRERMG